jgi:hypothetical protein
MGADRCHPNGEAVDELRLTSTMAFGPGDHRPPQLLHPIAAPREIVHLKGAPRRSLYPFQLPSVAISTELSEMRPPT